MFKYYFSFKKSDKRTRWLYNDEIDTWKKSGSSAYTDRFFRSYSFYVAALFFLVAFLAVTIHYLPFRGLFDGLRSGSIPAISLWVFYVFFMLIYALFVKRSRTAFILYFLTTIVLLVVSDVMILEYDTPFYMYLLYAFLISLMVSLIILLISRLFFDRSSTNSKPPSRKNKNNF